MNYIETSLKYSVFFRDSSAFFLSGQNEMFNKVYKNGKFGGRLKTKLDIQGFSLDEFYFMPRDITPEYKRMTVFLM